MPTVSYWTIVYAGKITLIYEATPVSYTFLTDGVYTTEFSDDWNLITAVNDQSAHKTS